MTTSQVINQTLWNELRAAINKTYQQATAGFHDGQVLRDYAEDIGWSDDLADLLARETANEKNHRHNRPSVPGFSPSTAARLILMNCVVKGAQRKEMPSATDFLVFRKTAVEAEVIGWLIRKNLDPNWIKAVDSYDYAKLMQAA